MVHERERGDAGPSDQSDQGNGQQRCLEVGGRPLEAFEKPQATGESRGYDDACLRSRYLIAFKNLLRSIESLGIASVYGINYFGRGILSADNYVSYVRHEALGRDLLTGSLTYVPSLKRFYADLTRSMTDYSRIKSRYTMYTCQ